MSWSRIFFDSEGGPFQVVRLSGTGKLLMRCSGPQKSETLHFCPRMSAVYPTPAEAILFSFGRLSKGVDS